jgi:NaMN:DMB phosphoribosyltransferase
MVAVAGLLRHAGVEQSLPLATTSYVADDETAAIESAADELDLDLEVTDPGFGRSDHPAMATYAAGEAKEGVGMGGALALATRAGIPMADVRERVATIADGLAED